MSDDPGYSPELEASERIHQFVEEMQDLHLQLQSATDVWELSVPDKGTMHSGDVWSNPEANSEYGHALAVMGRSKKILGLFDSGRGLTGLVREMRPLALNAVDILDTEVTILVPHEERLKAEEDRVLRQLQEIADDAKELGEVSPELSRQFVNKERELGLLKDQQGMLRARTALHADPLELLQAFPSFTDAINALDRATAARRRQRQLARLSHPAFQFAILFLIGVVGVNLLSDQVSALGSGWVWLFAIASFVMIDYLLEPWLAGRMDRRSVALLQRELEETQKFVVSVPLILSSLAVISATVPGMGDLMGKVTSIGGQFLPGARLIVRLGGNADQATEE